MNIAFNKMMLLAAAVSFLASCSPKLLGTWSIEKYEVMDGGKSTIAVSNIGTITFNKKNEGVKEIQYAIFQNDFSDKSPFKWFKENDNTVRIEGQASDFNKTWLITENGGKQQVWKSTDGGSKVQTLKLKKQ